MVFCWHVTDFYIPTWPRLLMVTSRTLKAKQRTGRGQLIDVSLLRSGLWCNGMMLAAAASAPNNPAAVVRATIHFLRFRSDCAAFNASFLQPKKKKKRRRKSMSSLHFFGAEPPPQHVASFLLYPTFRFLYFSFSHFPIFPFFSFLISVTLSDGHCLLHHHWLHLYKEYMRDPRRLGPTFRVRARNDNDLW